MTDWSRWRKCPVCAAETGQSCTDLMGYLTDGGHLRVVMKRPHSTRPRSTRKAVKP